MILIQQTLKKQQKAKTLFLDNPKTLNTMEKFGSLDRDTIMSVLSEGRNLASELKRKLNPGADSRDACDFLVENILSSYENAIKLLDCMDMLENGVPSPPAHVSHSIQGSPLISEASSELTSKDEQPHKCKKRKALPKWSEQVRVRSETGFEGQLDDGYNWRKYGQKDILGANHPRAYYRCTHRNTQGCLATKQVQRVDEDHSFFDVIYRGKHSCMQERLKQNKENNLKEFEGPNMSSQENNLKELPCLKAENQELVVVVTKEEEDPFPSFSFPSTPIESENLDARFFNETNDFTGINYSPPFLSPATSESYFSMSHCPINDYGNDFGEIISNPSSFPNFPLGDLDISIDQTDFGSHLLDAIDYYW